MSTVDESNAYWLAHIVIVGLITIPSFVLTICALCLARRKKDPARLAFTYMKLAFAFFTGYTFLDTITWILAYLIRNVYDFEYTLYYPGLRQASSHLGNLGGWSENIAHIFILLSLFELASGILLVQTGQKSAIGKIGRWVVLGAVALLAIIALTGFALWASFFTEIYSMFSNYVGDGPTAALEMKAIHARRLDAAFYSMLFVTNVGVLALAIFVMVKVNRHPQVHQSAVFLLVCTCLWLLRNVWKVAYVGSWYSLDSYFSSREIPLYIDAVDAVLNALVVFVLLTILFALGAKKAKGLWSTPQGFLVPVVQQQQQQQWNGGMVNGGAYPPPPQGYIYASPPPQHMQNGQQMGWQPQQQMQPQMQYMPQQPQAAYYPQQQQQQQLPQQQPIHHPPVSEVSSSSPPPMQHQQPYVQGREVSDFSPPQHQEHTGVAPAHELVSHEAPKPQVHS